MRDPSKSIILVAYIPVLHAGYIKYFQAHPEASGLYLIDLKSVDTTEYSYLKKDIRMIGSRDASAAISGLHLFNKVDVLTDDKLRDLDKVSNIIVLPDEDISRSIATRFKNAEIEYYGVFLRWDRRKLEGINASAADTERVTSDEKDVESMKSAASEAIKSTDIWRRVGAALLLDEKVYDVAHNEGEPHAFSPWLEGDPRNAFHRGVGIEMSIFTHAEALLIARAARLGVKLQNASLYVTDYPCPACAKLIAHSGIARVYFREGYAVLDGKTVLDEYEVEVARVIMPEDDVSTPEVWVPYKKP